MAYRLKAKESVPEGIRRIVTEEVDAALTELGANHRTQRDHAIHEARKSVKKVRGVLRLMRGELSSHYRGENKRFRAIGRKLSELRDAAAVLETFQQISNRSGERTAGTDGRKIQGGLQREKKALEARLDVPKVVSEAVQVLEHSKGDVSGWPLKRDGFNALAPGLKETYRRGRKALRRARKKGTEVDFHTLRKRVKDHWYHVRLLESIWTEVMQAHEASLKELETWLGDDHNLVVMESRLEAQPQKFGGEENVESFSTAIRQRQQELREMSLSLGERIYGDKPKAFIRNVESLWDAWQRQPESMAEVEAEQREKNEQPSAPPTTPRKPVKAARGKSQSSHRGTKKSVA